MRFASPILCEVAYAGLPFGLRRALHAAVGEALERDLGTDVDADPAVLSLHFSRAGDHDRAWRYALLGAERAARALRGRRRGAAVPARDRSPPRRRGDRRASSPPSGRRSARR